MGQAEWRDVLTLALSIIAREPPPFQIFTWLGLAFVALMILEGLRASFLPRRAASPSGKMRLSDADEIRRPPEARSSTISSPFAPRGSRTAFANNRKREAEAPRRQTFARPNIKRTAGALENKSEQSQIDDTVVETQSPEVALSEA